ncbi:MAG: FtsB family cell division protein [bacterium]|jgi:cell division protein DivIC
MKFVRFFKNKYLLATVFFVVWMLFFDHNTIFQHIDYRGQLHELKQSKKYYQEQIDKTRKEVELMRTNPFWMEKVAREQYLMKREGEDVFLIREKSNEQGIQ